MKKTLLAIFYISLIYVANSQVIKNTIIVKDADTDVPIEYCNIYNNNKLLATTNVLGIGMVMSIGEDSVGLNISYVGYTTKNISFLPTSKSAITVYLSKGNFTLKTITASTNTINSYNKIAALDFKLKPINSAQDMLRSVPGLFIAQHAGGGKAEQIFLRGFDIDHGTDINITVDGIPVNMTSHAHGQGYADLHFLNPETVEKVIFDKGPHAVEKGNLSTAGYVEFKTKEFLKDNTVKIEAGIFDTKRVTALVKLFGTKTATKNQQLYVAGEYVFSNGYFESAQNFNRLNLMAKYTSVKNNQNKFSLAASTFTSKWDASGQIPERAVEGQTITRFGAIDNLEGGDTKRTNIVAQLNNKLKNEGELQQHAYFTNYKFNLFSNFTFFKNDPVNGDMINQNEGRNIFGYSIKLKNTGLLFNKKVTTNFCAGFRYDNVKNISLSAAPKRIITNAIQTGAIKELNTFAFANSILQLNNTLQLNTSLRLDNFRFGYNNKLTTGNSFKYINKSVFSPKATLNANINSKVSLFVSSSVGFHSNDARLILADTINEILPKVFGNDVGIILKPNSKFLVKAIVWHLASAQEFVYVGDEGVIEAGGRSERIGIDLLMRYQINNWLFADADFSLAKPRAIDEPKGAQYIPLAPTFTSIGGLSAKIGNKGSVALRYRYLANRAANADYSLTADGYLLLDFVANYKVRKFDFGITIENMFNQKWKEAQFETTTRLRNEPAEVTEIHFTPGTPFFIKTGVTISF
jgi:outer membrane cobalamin receptor